MVLAHDVSEGFRTRDIQITQDVTFESMLLSSFTLQGLQESGFYKPSPVQLHAIPLGKCGFDLLLEAKSGTGKTAVFSVIALEKLDLSKGLQVVILAPTREIASQICDVIRQIGVKYKGLNVAVVMGGLPVEDDINKFKKNVHIVVGSPGRLRHLVQDKYIDVSFVRLLVLDEADRLMEKSFLPDINYIFSVLPPQKQVILSSATYTDNTKEFIKKYVKSAQHVCPDSNCVLLGVEQKITLVKFNANIVKQTQNRFEELLKIISKKTFKQCLIFCNYQARVTEVHKLLTKHKWPAEQLYGQQDQTDRLGALKTLQEYKCRILIATDLAARGIDASNVDLVVNFEPPFEWQTYLHRIGRAGRFGSYGMSITILSEGKEEKKFRDMIELLKVPLNIELFWTSGKNDLELELQIEPEIESQTMNTKFNLINNPDDPKLQELWNQLTGNHHNAEKIESFETLCESFEETKAEVVESFDDLLKSFQSEPVVEKPNEYQHLQSTSQEIEKYTNSLRVLKENDSKLNIHLNDVIKSCTETEKVSDNIKTDVKRPILKKYYQSEAAQGHKENQEIEKYTDSLRVLKEDDSKLNIHLNDKIKSCTETENVSDDIKTDHNKEIQCGRNNSKKRPILKKYYQSEAAQRHKENNIGSLPSLEEEPYMSPKITDTEELSTAALLDAGFPVQFGKPKDIKKHITNSFTPNKNLLVSDMKEQRNLYHTNRSKTKRNYSKARINLNEYDRPKHGLHNENRKSYHSHKGEIENSDSDISESVYANENYVNWYNQFKLRMRQIEIAFYIEEMSHL